MLRSGPQGYCCIPQQKESSERVSTMYFYITAYRQYLHSGSDARIHNWLASGESILLLSPSAPDLRYGSWRLRSAPAAAHGCWAFLPLWWMLPLDPLSLFIWTGFSLFDSLDRVCRGRLTLLESEYCPTSFPTIHPKVPYKWASPGPKQNSQFLYQAWELYTRRSRIPPLAKQVLLQYEKANLS